MSWLSDWSYRKSHEIQPAMGAETNYQVEINVHNNSAPGAWTTKQAMPYAVSDQAAVVYNDKLYLFGGYGTSNLDVKDYTLMYDPASNSWDEKTSMPTARWGAASAEVDGIAYVFGGNTGGAITQKCEAYDIANDSWSTKTDLPADFNDQGLMAITVGSKIYLFFKFVTYEFDPAGNGGDGAYTQKEDSPATRRWACCGYVQVNGEDRIYVIGGSPAGGTSTDVNYFFNVNTNTWSAAQAKAPYPAYGTIRENPVLDGKIYYCFGYNDGWEHGKKLYKYVPSTDSWSLAQPEATYYRDGVAGGFINGKLYAVGGNEDHVSPYGLNYNEEFDPDGGTAGSGNDVYLGGNCRTDFGDIRFTDNDGSTELNYWMKRKAQGEDATFWVKVTDNLNSRNQTIYVYYDGAKTVATTSNGDDTFEFFEDFDGHTLDSDKWDINAVNTITYAVAEKELKVSDATKTWISNNTSTGSQHQAKNAPVDNICIEWQSQFPTMTEKFDMGKLGVGLIDADNKIRAYLSHMDEVSGYIQPKRWWFYETTTANETAKADETKTFKITRIGSTVKFYIDDTLKTTGTLTGTPTKIAVAVGAYSGYTFAKANIRYLIVRKFVNSEPGHGSWGSEESKPADIEYLLDRAKWDAMRWDYFRWDVFEPTWERAVKRLEETKGTATADVVRRKIVLGSRDTTTGWRIPIFTSSTIKMLIRDQGVTTFEYPPGVYHRVNGIGECVAPVVDGDQILTDDGRRYEVAGVKDVWKANSFVRRDCGLVRIPLWQAAPGSATWKTSPNDPRERTKAWIDTHANGDHTWITKDDGSTAASFATIFAHPPYPMRLEFRASSNPVHMLYVVAQPNSTPERSGDQIIRRYKEHIPVHIYAPDSTDVTGEAIAWKGYAELRYIAETYSTGTQRNLASGRGETIHLGGDEMYHVETVLEYARGTT